MLLQLQQHCHYRQKFGAKPQHFKFTLRDDSIAFNHNIYCDILTIEKVQVLHVVDEATRFKAAANLANMTAEELWRALKSFWINVYLGPPDIITHDSGINFVARSFEDNAALLHITCTKVPVEGANRMSIVERYHEPLRRAFRIMRTKCPKLYFDDIYYSRPLKA